LSQNRIQPILTPAPVIYQANAATTRSGAINDKALFFDEKSEHMTKKVALTGNNRMHQHRVPRGIGFSKKLLHSEIRGEIVAKISSFGCLMWAMMIWLALLFNARFPKARHAFDCTSFEDELPTGGLLR
jgi:hypothetical protein